MRRQTRRDSTGKAFFKPADPDCGSCRNCDRLAGCMGRWAEALAACEDTGLTADELPRAAELLEADRDGRCVVLPCRVGDTVYLTARGIVEETKVRTIFLGHPSYNGGEPDPGIEMVRLTNFDVPIKSFGKTVFLTRTEAEAEAALEAKT